MARPTLLTPEIAEQIILAIRAGAPLKVAAESQGVADSTFHEWIARGKGTDPRRPEDAIYAEFAERVDVARAATHTRVVGTFTQAAMRNWQAAERWLRLRYPEQYAERSEISGPDRGPIPVEIVGVLEEMSEDELAAAAEALRRGGRPPADRGRTRKAKAAPKV